MIREQVHELLYQALETERGGINVYRTAIKCAQNDDLKKEWQKYLEQTENHERMLLEVFEELDLDPVAETPGRAIVRHLGESLVEAMEMARKNAEPAAAQLVAAECVVLAETKDHQNWELIGEIAKSSTRPEGKRLLQAYEEVEDEEDEHLYHTMGWARELWLKTLGLPAVIPPPEEEKDVKTMAAAAKAKANRKKML
jgi:rubrerythrin